MVLADITSCWPGDFESSIDIMSFPGDYTASDKTFFEAGLDNSLRKPIDASKHFHKSTLTWQMTNRQPSKVSYA